ncbi:UNVERIFIED_CONTAM: (-)-alpha-terpineol synthase [Sesamum angustifolium]|uniref:(-)-alpha-terpineol synthase n=1 Tax=Sesamum angustifolium TaxID=2727405 RepID=A0AAW2QBM8_9LAMI
MVECYLWSVGYFFHPEDGYPRIMTAKLNALITVIDDIFDVYGTLQELQLFYNAIQSSFVVANPAENEFVGSLHKYKDIVRYSGMILRLADDLGTSPAEMKRGDVAKAVECYMNERGGSREEAEEYVRYLIDETWKKMNEGVAAAADDSPFLQDFVRIAADVGRTAQYFYQHGDGHGIQNPQMKQSIPTLLFQPII